MSGATSLFENTDGRNCSKNLVEFKAGKINTKGTMMNLDDRKGLLYIHQSDDSSIHFCWKDLSSAVVEDDLIILPNHCEFKSLPYCTIGRVYVLQFKFSSQKFFFWLQESNTDKDDENCRRINYVMNNPPAPVSNRSGDGDLQNVLSNVYQQQLMQLSAGVGQIGGLSSLLGTMRSSAQPANTSTTTNTSSGINRTTTASSSTPPTNSVTRGPTVDLSATMDMENLQSDIKNTSQLAQHLTPSESASDSTPISQTAPDNLKDIITSPQFRQAVSMFSNALQTGLLGSVVLQFDLGEGAVSAANQENMDKFVQALQQANISAEETNACPINPENAKKPNNDDIGSK